MDPSTPLCGFGTCHESHPVPPTPKLSSASYNGPYPIGAPSSSIPHASFPPAAPAAPAPVWANMVDILAPAVQPVGEPPTPP